MTVLLDARPPTAAALLAAVRTARPGWVVHLLVAAGRPFPDDTGLTQHTYAPPLPDTPANRRVNELHFADWIAARRPAVVIHPEPLDFSGLLPRYTAPRPRVVVTITDPAAALAKLTTDTAVEISPGLRLAAAADVVLGPAADIRRLIGDGPQIVADVGELVHAVEAPAGPVAPRKPRIAWVSPAPPAATGVADYALEVAVVLAERFDLEWVLDPRAKPPTADVLTRFRTLTADEFDDRHAARPFDLPVYHLGNNHFHTYQLPLMRRHPGLVVAHDTHTGGLYFRSAEAGVWPADFPEELTHNGDTLLAHWVRHGLVHPHTTPTFSAFNRRPLAGAAGVLVHSAYGWRQVRKVSDSPAMVVPLIAVPPPLGAPADERKRLGIPTDRFVIASLGIVSEPKRPAVILRAAAALPPDIRARVLVLLVGAPEPDIRGNLEKLAADLGMTDQFRMLGRVPLDDFPAYATAADACVQLRYPCNGETSAALVRAMAAGAACVVSDTGAMAEVPNAVALKVRSPALDEPDLTAVLTRLARDPGLGERMRSAARQYMYDTHRPEVVVTGYAAAISATIVVRDAADGRWRAEATNALADLPDGIPDGLIEAWATLRAAAIR
ncbi:MAG: glycosyltransferase family 4 protein [Fimbriiglobus sp.]